MLTGNFWKLLIYSYDDINISLRRMKSLLCKNWEPSSSKLKTESEMEKAGHLRRVHSRAVWPPIGKYGHHSTEENKDSESRETIKMIIKIETCHLQTNRFPSKQLNKNSWKYRRTKCAKPVWSVLSMSTFIHSMFNWCVWVTKYCGKCYPILGKQRIQKI